MFLVIKEKEKTIKCNSHTMAKNWNFRGQQIMV